MPLPELDSFWNNVTQLIPRLALCVPILLGCIDTTTVTALDTVSTNNVPVGYSHKIEKVIETTG